MKIQVTQQHIDRGFKGSCTQDPIALALADAGFTKPRASPTYLSVEGWRGERDNYPTPESVLEFMKQYDNDRLVWPFEFELEE